MRARNLKPGFFKNAELADAGPHAQLLFAGLWLMADKEGRLKDQPRVIKAELFPYYEVDVHRELTVIERLGHIQRYTASGIGVIEVVNFKRHQSPHHTEKPSELPENPSISSVHEIHGELTVNSPLENGGNPSDSLIPDSLIPDSLIPDSLIHDDAVVGSPKSTGKKKPKSGTPAFHQTVIDTYHRICTNLPSVKVWSPARRRALDERIRERCAEGKAANTARYWEQFFEKVAASDFLNGRKGGDWHADLEWLLVGKHFVRVIEDRYANRGSSNGAHAHG